MPLYFTGKRPAGYIVITDPELKGGKVELETRQCAHCGYQWIYRPGSKKKYGVCLVCMGFTCVKKECNEKCMPLEQKFELYEKSRRLG